MKIEDHPFPYRVSANAYPAHCHVRLIRPDIRPELDVLLLVSELASNQGMSVCNAFEDLLPQIVLAYELDPEHLTVVEHWGSFSYTAADRRSADLERDEEFTVPAFFQCAKRIVVKATYFQCHRFQSVVHSTEGALAPNLWTFSP